MSHAEFQVVAEGQGAPQASVLVPTYRSAYLEQALGSILAQRDVILELLVSDDASGDDTPQRILRRLRAYYGPHRLLLRQGKQRLQLDHFALLADAASCEVTLMAHDDDLALPHRARRVLDLFMATGADVISSNCLVIDGKGRQLGTRIQEVATGFIPVEQIIHQVWLPPFLGATLAWRRSVYADFPRLDTCYLPSGHDCLIPFRGALHNGFYYIDESLLLRRRHATQWSKRMVDHRSQLTSQEARAARLLGICVAMQKDITYLRQHTTARIGDNCRRLDQLEALVTQSLTCQATEMFERRSRLLLAGRQMMWVDAATFAHHQQPSLLRRLFQHEPLHSMKRWIRK